MPTKLTARSIIILQLIVVGINAFVIMLRRFLERITHSQQLILHLTAVEHVAYMCIILYSPTVYQSDGTPQ